MESNHNNNSKYTKIEFINYCVLTLICESLIMSFQTFEPRIQQDIHLGDYMVKMRSFYFGTKNRK